MHDDILMYIRRIAISGYRNSIFAKAKLAIQKLTFSNPTLLKVATCLYLILATVQEVCLRLLQSVLTEKLQKRSQLLF